MENLISLSVAAVLVGAALRLLVLAVSRLGTSDGIFSALQVMGLVTLKFAILALGLGWMSKQPWFHAGAAAFGIAIPLTALVLIKGRATKTEKNDV